MNSKFDKLFNTIMEETNASKKHVIKEWSYRDLTQEEKDVLYATIEDIIKTNIAANPKKKQKLHQALLNSDLQFDLSERTYYIDFWCGMFQLNRFWDRIGFQRTPEQRQTLKKLNSNGIGEEDMDRCRQLLRNIGFDDIIDLAQHKTPRQYKQIDEPTGNLFEDVNASDDPLEMVINMLKNQDWDLDWGDFDVEDIADEFCCKYEEDGGDWNNLNKVKRSLRKYIKDVVIGGNI